MIAAIMAVQPHDQRVPQDGIGSTLDGDSVVGAGSVLDGSVVGGSVVGGAVVAVGCVSGGGGSTGPTAGVCPDSSTSFVMAHGTLPEVGAGGAAGVVTSAWAVWPGCTLSSGATFVANGVSVGPQTTVA
jgi:hypothetical protein